MESEGISLHIQLPTLEILQLNIALWLKVSKHLAHGVKSVHFARMSREDSMTLAKLEVSMRRKSLDLLELPNFTKLVQPSMSTSDLTM